MSIRTSRPGKRRANCLRNRRPRRCKAERTATSGRVSVFLFPFITAETCRLLGAGYSGSVVLTCSVYRHPRSANLSAGMKLVSLFTGPGGLDLGLEAAGFETVAAVEMNPDAVQTLRLNRPWPVLDEDIHHVSSKQLLSVSGLREGELDLLAGGPPCQPFSKSGYWAHGDSRRLEDPRASTLEAYLRVLRDLKPRAFLLENVAGLAYERKSEGLDLLRATIDSINREYGTSYSFQMALLNAASYGVPQLRERIFIIGHREGRDFSFPKPTHALPSGSSQIELSLENGHLQPFLTTWDAIGDLEDDDDPELAISGRWAALLPSIPEGQNYLWHTDRGGGEPLFGWRRRYWSFLLKLAKDLPSWTITAQPGSAIGPFHWKSRRLSARELCRLQTFPADYRIFGSRSSAQRQLGNAVPSALAEVLGAEIRSQLLDRPQERRRAPRLSLRRRRPIPAAEPIQPLPPEYHDLIGHHAPHPGTGQGYAAVRRELVAQASADQE